MLNIFNVKGGITTARG